MDCSEVHGMEGEAEGKRVEVVVRVRPFLKGEIAPPNRFTAVPLRVREDGAETVEDPEHPGFDRVFRDASQEEVYEDLGRPLLEKLLGGYNVCLLAYGQTGAGKTHTMSGPPASSPATHPQRGLAPRLLQELADRRKQLEAKDVLVEVEVQYVEIYRNKMYDLLKGSARVLNKDKKVPACLGSRGLANAAKFCLDPEQNDSMLRALIEGEERRRLGPGASQGATSSRSHALLCVYVTQRTPMQTLRSVCYMVDLAGSEDIRSVTGQDRAQQMEATSINASLYHLRLVVESLGNKSAENKDLQHSLRSSKLTESLREALTGNSHTVLMLNLKPGAAGVDADESTRTLTFGLCATKVRTVQTMNCEYTEQFTEVQQEIDVAEEKIQALQIETDDDELQQCLAEVHRLKKEAEERLAQEAREAQLVLIIRRKIMVVFLEVVNTTTSIYHILRLGIAPFVLDEFKELQTLIEGPIRDWEERTDLGIQGADKVILHVYHKVEGWLKKWKEGLGVHHREAMVEDDEHPEAAAGPCKPHSEWKKTEVEALYELTLDMNTDLFALENQKDEVNTNYVRLCAALNSVERELGKTREQLLERKGLSHEQQAHVLLLEVVVQHARQRLAERQAAVDDKGEEVMDHLNRTCALRIHAFLQALPKSRPFVPRLEAVQSWQDMLPLAADVLMRVSEEIDQPTIIHEVVEENVSPSKGSATLANEVMLDDPRGQGLGSGFAQLGNAVGAWVSDFKGVKRLNVRDIEEESPGGAFTAGKQGIALLHDHVQQLCKPNVVEGIREALNSDEFEPGSFEADLESEPRLSGVGVNKKSVITRVCVSQVEEKTGKYSSERHMQVDLREWVVDISRRRPSVTKPSSSPVKPPAKSPLKKGVAASSPSKSPVKSVAVEYAYLEPGEKGVALRTGQWGVLSRCMAHYQDLLAVCY